jgi:integrase
MAHAYRYEWTTKAGASRRAWRAVWVGADARPKAKRGFDRKADAVAWAQDREAEARHGVELERASPARRLTVKAWGETWLAGLQVRPSSVASYGHALHRVNVHLGGRALASLRPSELRSWRKSLDAHLAPSTADHTAAILAMLLRAAVLDGLIPSSPMPRRERAQASPLDPAQLLTLAQVQSWGAALPLVACEMPTVAATTGLRQGELLGLRPANVDFLRRQVHVVEQLLTPQGGGEPTWGPTKTPAGVRTVPLAAPAAEALARHLGRFPAAAGEPVFRTVTGRRWRRQTFGDVIRAGRAQAGLPAWAHWHGLRDVFASGLIFTRQDGHLITTLMGHSSAAELKVYARLWPESEDGARKAIEGLWSAPERHGNATGTASSTD